MTMQRRFQFIGDTELVRIAGMGSLEACDELVTRFRGAVLQVAAQALGSQEAAQDVAQEAFLMAFQALPQLQDPAKFPGWLCTIARHRARRVAMREGRQEATEDASLERLIIAHSVETVPTPLDTLLQSESERAIRTLLAGMPSELQIVLALFYYEQWTAARIAEFLSLPLTTVKWRLQSGRKELLRRLVASQEEKPNVRKRSQKRDTSYAPAAAENVGDGRACRAERQLRKRDTQFRETVQCDCGAS